MAYSGGVGIGPPPAVGGISRARQQGAGWGQAPGPRVPTGGVTYKPPKTPYKVPGTVAPTNWQMPQGGFQNTQPPAPGATSASNGGAGTTANDPYAGLDATYAANTAANLFDTTNKYNALTTQGANNEVALQSALAQLSGQLPYDQLKEQYSAEQGGGLYSTVYGQNTTRIAQAEADQALGLTTNAGNQATDIANQQAALRAGIPLYNDQERAASLARAVAALAKDPAAVVANVPGGSGAGINTGAQNPAGGTSVTRTALANAIAQARQRGAGFGQKAGPKVPTGGVSYRPVKGPSPFTRKTAPTRWR